MLTACDSNTGSADVSAPPSVQESRAYEQREEDVVLSAEEKSDTFDPSQVPTYTGEAYVVVHDNVPYFTREALTTEAFESYSPLDGYGRCGVAMACVGKEIMPTEDRGSIGQVQPSGWHTVRYETVDGGYLYNRCHLIGYQLTGENANTQNLITGTRALNIDGMLPFENMVADYVKETDNHVLYRVTPVFNGNDLVASGVLMEGYSVEDNGAGICYCVYAYNTQPGIIIDYATGDSREMTADESVSEAAEEAAPRTYVLNNHSMKFHYPECRSVDQMKEPQEVTTTRQSLIDKGYSPCGNCNP